MGEWESGRVGEWRVSDGRIDRRERIFPTAVIGLTKFEVL